MKPLKSYHLFRTSFWCTLKFISVTYINQKIRENWNMLILLQPGIEPLGQFDLEDDDTDLVRGGEVAVFEAIDYSTDGYAADVWNQGPAVHLSLDSVTAGSVAVPVEVYGLVDEGTSGGLGSKGYGTMFGSIIGATVGQGTGVGGMPGVGTVVIGPSTVRGSGKATLWTKPGLYGVTLDAFLSEADFTAAGAVAGLNAGLYGTTADGTNDGKLASDAAGGTGVDGAMVARSLGAVADSSLVSTTNTYAGLTTPEVEHCALYLLGVSAV
jgi:hypothetical protein